MPNPQAKMGYVGSVTLLGTTAGNLRLRATNCDVRAMQNIDYPDVVDGKIDRTLYQLGPRIVEGNIAFPLVHEGITAINSGRDCDQLTNQTLGEAMWRIASQRDSFGRLINQFDTQVRYTDDTHFKYPTCIVNSYTMSVTQSDMVNVSMDIIGGADSSDQVRLPSDNIEPEFLSPARVVTWNDFLVRIYGDNLQTEPIRGDYLREFEVTINNNAERFFTLNNKLAPQDITARKREINGRMVLMGRNTALSELAYNNQDRFTSTARIAFGYSLGGAGTVAFITALHGVVFEIEEIAITNDLVQTTVPFTALADCDNGYEATELGTSGTDLPSGNTFTPGIFGGRTSTGFPNWNPDD